MSTHPRKAVAEATHFDYATVKNNRQGAEVEILVGAGPRGETFARAVHRKGTKFEDNELFLKVLQTRNGNTFQCTVTKKSACAKMHTIQQDDLQCQRSDRS